jgi:hypothetical protein
MEVAREVRSNTNKGKIHEFRKRQSFYANLTYLIFLYVTFNKTCESATNVPITLRTNSCIIEEFVSVSFSNAIL